MELIEGIKTIDGLAKMGPIDRLLSGLVVAFIGMGVTFVALVLLWMMIKIIMKLSSFNIKDMKANLQKPEDVSQDYNLALASDNENDELEDDAIIAAISAAIHQALGSKVFHIRHISRISEGADASWRQGEEKPWK